MDKKFDTNNLHEWEKLYIGDDTGWDLGAPTPVFTDIAKDLRPGKLCILGCGHGYDAIMFSEKGFNVTAVDFAPAPIKYINERARELSLDINTIEENIFTLTPKLNNHFEYIIEQTCFCAIDPKKRKTYHDLVYNLLKPGGLIIGLWFPIGKALSEGGPPFAVSEKEVKSLFNNRWDIKKDEFPNNSVEPRSGREKLIIFKKL